MPPSLPAQILRAQANALLTRSLSVHPLPFGLTVFRLSYTADMPSEEAAIFGTAYPAKVVEGFALSTTIQDFIHGKTAVLRSERGFVFMPAGLRQRIATDDIYPVLKDWEKLEMSQLPYTAFEKGDANPEDLLDIDMSNNVVLTRTGEPMPQPLHFDYMDGYLNNGAYDLEKALPVLRANPRVRPSDVPRGQRDELSILPVPSYNRRTNQSQYLAVTFIPTMDELQRMVAHIPASRLSRLERYRAVFELDILGLRAAGAAKYPTYEGIDPDNGDCDEDN